jgi:hypothetical protein
MSLEVPGCVCFECALPSGRGETNGFRRP